MYLTFRRYHLNSNVLGVGKIEVGGCEPEALVEERQLLVDGQRGYPGQHPRLEL